MEARTSSTPAIETCGCSSPGQTSLGRILKVVAVTLAMLGGLWAWRAVGSDGKTTAAQGGGPDSCALFDQSHGAWTNLLSRYVRAGFVDYAGLKKGGQADLGAYLSSLESFK